MFSELFKKKNICVGVVLVLMVAFCASGCKKAEGAESAADKKTKSKSKTKTVGDDIKEDDFREFFYTYSKTVNPPEFQRYRFYIEDGKYMFYHEKREGDNVFLTEDDITISGVKELTEEECNKFFKLISGGNVRNRREDDTTGGSGPWLYLYWNGDEGKCQEFSFKENDDLFEFEEFCIELKELELSDE